MTAPSGYDISIEVTVDNEALDTDALVALAREVMDGEAVKARTSLSILLTGDDEVRRLNNQFLGIDEATDVLSFPDLDDDDFVTRAGGAPHLGDIAVALPTAARQAQHVGHALDAELAHLLVHGILHLCGYDHVDDLAEERRMREHEEHYLGGSGAVHHH